MATDHPPSLDPNDPQQVVASAWADQALWSEVANRTGASIRLWRARAAVAGVAGLFLSLLAGSMGPGQPGGTVGQKVVATLGVLLLALVPFLQQRLLSSDRVLAWTRARQVAERLKEAIYRHLMGALPAVPLQDGSPPPDPTGPGNLVRCCRAIKQDAADLSLLAATADPQPRQRKTVMTLDDYLADRLDGQVDYYRKSSMAAGGSAQRLQQIEFGLGLLTVLLGAFAGNLLPAAATPDLVQASPLAPWLALVATAGAAISSHIASTRNLETAAKYFATHDLLKTLRDEWSVDPGRDHPPRVLRLVDEVERAIAAEHGGWVSAWRQAGQGGPAAAAAGGGGAPAPGPVQPEAAPMAEPEAPAAELEAEPSATPDTAPSTAPSTTPEAVAPEPPADDHAQPPAAKRPVD